jgi:hypothetical protein
MDRAAFSLTWGVKGQIRVLLLTGAQGQPPEDLLDAARDAFQSPLNFEVRVKLHPVHYNPTGRLLARLREELRHLFHMEQPWWWMVGVSAPGRFPPHWTFLKSRGWRDTSYIKHLEWADIIVYDTTTLATKATCPVLHWIGRERIWRYNPAKAQEVGDPLRLRYEAYRLGRGPAMKRGLAVWRRRNGAIILREYGAI